MIYRGGPSYREDNGGPAAPKQRKPMIGYWLGIDWFIVLGLLAAIAFWYGVYQGVRALL